MLPNEPNGVALVSSPLLARVPFRSAKVGGILSATDQGLITPPDNIAGLRRIIGRLRAEQLSAGVPVPARNQLADAVYAAALADRELPTDEAVLAALDAENVATARRIALATAVERLESDMYAQLLQLDTTPMYAALDGQLHELLAEVTAVAEVIGAGDPDSIVEAGDEGRAAWLAMPDLLNRYRLIRKTQSALDMLHPARSDIHGEFAEFTTPPEPSELPTEPRRRLLYLALHPELETWVPSARQRDRCKLDEAERDHQHATRHAAGQEGKAISTIKELKA